MPRSPRRDTVIPDHPHHVIVRGNNRRILFSYPTCYRTFLVLLAQASRDLALPVHALVLMRNHVHLVATPRDAEHLAAWVKHFAQRYASRRNRARESSGKLFEQRYRAIPIRTEAQLAATLPYIELNPVRAGMVTTPLEWRWSTYAQHTNAAGASAEVSEVWTPHSWWCALGATATARARAYAELTQLRDEAARQADEASADERYAHRIERPDRTRAAEAVALEYRSLSNRS